MKVVLDPRAIDDLTHIHSWIAADNPSAAAGVIEAIFAGTERLALYSLMGRAGRVEGTREWVVPRLPYILVYRPDEVRDELRVIAALVNCRPPRLPPLIPAKAGIQKP